MEQISSLGEGQKQIRSWDTLFGVSHKDHFACMPSEVAHDFIVPNTELRKCSKIVCLACDQVIELPVKHPELFEALGIDQPKVRFD